MIIISDALQAFLAESYSKGKLNKYFVMFLKQIITHKLPFPSAHVHKEERNNHKSSEMVRKKQYESLQKQNRAKQKGWDPLLAHQASWSSSHCNSSFFQGFWCLLFWVTALWTSVWLPLKGFCQFIFHFPSFSLRKLHDFYLLFLIILWPNFPTLDTALHFQPNYHVFKMNHIFKHPVTLFCIILLFLP